MARARSAPAAFLLTVLLLALSTVGLCSPATAGPTTVTAPATVAAGCSVAQWESDFRGCASKLKDLGAVALGCVKAPVPGAPDSGLPGWFVSKPSSATAGGPQGLYSQYGYAGYDFAAYDTDCAPDLVNPQGAFENTIANGEFMAATAVIGASNAMRERAWDPRSMWAWADPLVTSATRAIYTKVFSVFGIITLCVVGLYLIWRSRQADMSAALTTAGWALLVMVAVTALAAWPVTSANLADTTLINTLGVVHDAVGPRPATIAGTCTDTKCEDQRPPAVRASDTATETMLFRNWLRGTLGSADSGTAQKYGRALYDAKSLTWDEAAKGRASQDARKAIVAAKAEQWNKIAAQIKDEDPEAYEYLTGAKGMDRIGAGFIALLSSVLFAMFDLVASVLVLLGFLIFRWAVIAAPVLGTIGMLRPASSGIRRLANAVVAAIFNICIFGTGAAIYLFAVDIVMSTPTLPGWLQVVLVWLCGMVGWLLLRPYRRITQLGGKDTHGVVNAAGSWHRRFFRDVRDAAVLEAAVSVSKDHRQHTTRVVAEDPNARPESRFEDPATSRPTPSSAPEPSAPAPAAAPARARPVRTGWTEPEAPDLSSGYSVYRPDRADSPAPAPTPRVRAEAR